MNREKAKLVQMEVCATAKAMADQGLTAGTWGNIAGRIDDTYMVITPSGMDYSKLVPDTYNHYSSTHQDIQRKIRTEIDSLNGKVIELGVKNNVDVTTNEIIYNLIKSIESGF